LREAAAGGCASVAVGKSRGGFRPHREREREREREGETGEERSLPRSFRARGGFSAGDTSETAFSFALTVTTPKRNRRWRFGGRLGRIMRVECAGGATWEGAMPPLAPSDRSPTTTPELNCSATYPPSATSPPRSQGFLAARLKYANVACRLNLGIVVGNFRRSRGSVRRFGDGRKKDTKDYFLHKKQREREREGERTSATPISPFTMPCP